MRLLGYGSQGKGEHGGESTYFCSLLLSFPDCWMASHCSSPRSLVVGDTLMSHPVSFWTLPLQKLAVAAEFLWAFLRLKRAPCKREGDLPASVTQGPPFSHPNLPPSFCTCVTQYAPPPPQSRLAGSLTVGVCTILGRKRSMKVGVVDKLGLKA